MAVIPAFVSKPWHPGLAVSLALFISLKALRAAGTGQRSSFTRNGDGAQAAKERAAPSQGKTRDPPPIVSRRT
jgi:hypothetical protein